MVNLGLQEIVLGEKRGVVSKVPLIVDLDGTLIRGDMLIKSALYHLSRDPGKLLNSLRLIAMGKELVKSELSEGFRFSADSLEYRLEVLDLVSHRISTGGKVYLSTGSDARIAREIANHLGVFTEVFASKVGFNNTGTNKAADLEQRFRAKGFDYVGNSRADFAVWKIARNSYLAGPGIFIKSRFLKLPDSKILR